nr:ribonuclease H-like domain-containing protein [Tanacetum cinerariifolium]
MPIITTMKAIAFTPYNNLYLYYYEVASLVGVVATCQESSRGCTRQLKSPFVTPLGDTPVDTDSKLGPEGVAVQDPTLYRSLAGGLQYLTFTRPDLSYAVQQICLYMHDPREPHFAALKRILRYVRGTVDFGLYLYLPLPPPSLGDNLLSWSSKRQHTISRSNAEAEYRGVANVVAETAWLRNLLHESHSPLSTATLTGHIRVLHVPSRYQYADIFTKGLPTALFEDFRSSLSVRLPPAQTMRAY